MQAVILAGGLGERLRPFTQAIPKPLLPIGEKSLLEIQISNLVKAGCGDVYLATNYKSDYIQNFIGDGSQLGTRIHYSREERPLGTCGPLSLLRTELDEPFLVMNGDILTTLDLRSFYEFGLAQDSDFTIATKNVGTPFNFGRVETDGNRIVSVTEKPEFHVQVVAGIYFMRPEILRIVPDETYFGIDDLIQHMLGTGLAVTRYLMEDYWLDIGRVEDYREAEAAYDTHFKRRPA